MSNKRREKERREKEADRDKEGLTRRTDAAKSAYGHFPKTGRHAFARCPKMSEKPSYQHKGANFVDATDATQETLTKTISTLPKSTRIKK